MGAIDIDICHNKMKNYNVQLSSGFEKFIIGIAIRMVLYKISQTTKPNIFIIDEGWSCLDDDNLNNIESIINFIKQEFDHVIIITHIEQLKDQADYVINISRKNTRKSD